jgi:hypothetical protein
MTEFIVKTVWLRGEGGAVFRMALPLAPDYTKQLRKGMLRQVNEDGTAYTGSDALLALPTERPSNDADKASWVSWAVANGGNADTAESMTVRDLIEKYGNVKLAEPEGGEPEGGEPTTTEPQSEPPAKATGRR